MTLPERTRPSVFDLVTAQILEHLETGTVPWHRPWSVAGGAAPVSMSTGKTYRGINQFLLECSGGAAGHISPWWGTYRRIAELGGQVRKGEKSSLCVLWRWVESKSDDSSDEGGEAVKGGRRPILRYYHVFNADQADALPAIYRAPTPTTNEHEPIERCEAIVAGYADGPTIVHGGSMACYSPSADRVSMPAPEAFEKAEAYYSALWHELTHSTGHAWRLARKDLLESHRFGDPSYSREELVAEMGAAMLSAVAGISLTTVPRSAAYLDSWVKVLRGDSRLVVTAAAQAQKAADRILGTSFEAEDAEA